MMGESVDEEQRLQELHDLKILDTGPDVRFDRITRLAADLIDAPMALITLVDEHRQWFKSHIGIDETETPRELAFCAHTIKTPAVMIVEDATQDERFRDNPLVTGFPNIRFYAGAPLVTQKGARLGTLCVVDTKPRKLETFQVSVLENLAKLVVDALDAHRIAGIARAEAERTALAERESRDRANELSQANRALDQFAGAVSHDLRTPLRQIDQYAGLVREHLAGDEEGLFLLDSLARCADRSRRLIDGMLRFARESNRNTTRAPASLAAIFSSVEASVRRDLSDCALSRDLGDAPEVHADADLIGQVFQNLVTNALKYRAERPLEISVSASSDGAFVEASVADNGRGIDPDQAEKIFLPFVRLDADDPDGAGIGLSLCRSIVESHGGRIWLDTAHAPGTRIRFTLPVAGGAESD